jgi:hypothetical protein
MSLCQARSRWASKHDRLIAEVIARAGTADLDAIAIEVAIRTGPDAALTASLLERYGQQYLDDCLERSIANARGEVLAFVQHTKPEQTE